MADETPALFDRGLDRNHRSYLSAVQGAQLATFRPRPSRELLRVDPRHVPWYAFLYFLVRTFDSILIVIANVSTLHCAGCVRQASYRFVGWLRQGRGKRDPTKRWDADRALLAALVDRWRPETHTYHLPCGEMAPTLQDVSYLLGLPLAGDAVGPVDGAVGWKADITERFSHVMRLPGLPAPRALHHYTTVGPSKVWLLQFTVS